MQTEDKLMLGPELNAVLLAYAEERELDVPTAMTNLARERLVQLVEEREAKAEGANLRRIYEDVKAGNSKPADQVHAELAAKYGFKLEG